MRRYAVVRAAWDEEAKVWFVEESDIPGLATEAGMLEALRRKVPALIQDLLEGAADRPDEIGIDFIARRVIGCGSQLEGGVDQRLRIASLIDPSGNESIS